MENHQINIEQPVVADQENNNNNNNNNNNDGENNNDNNVQAEVHIRRYRRQYRRTDVFGYVFLMLASAWMVISIWYITKSLGYVKFHSSSDYVPRTFSWKMAHEATLCKVNDNGENNSHEGCIAHNIMVPVKKESGIRPEDGHGICVTPLKYQSCPYHVTNEEVLTGILSGSFLSLLTFLNTFLYLTSLTCRRSSVMEFFTLIPICLTCFIDVVYMMMYLVGNNNAGAREELYKLMKTSLDNSFSPEYITIPWIETQTELKCCGIFSSNDWQSANSSLKLYPKSCCNTDKFNCTQGYPDKNSLWENGCLEIEIDRVHSFLNYMIRLTILMIMTHTGLFIVIYELTRRNYPAPETIETSSIDMRGLHIKAKGLLEISKVENYSKVILIVKNFKPTFRIQMTRLLENGSLSYILDYRGKLSGSVDINYNNQTLPNVTLDETRGRRGIYTLVFRNN